MLEASSLPLQDDPATVAATVAERLGGGTCPRLGAFSPELLDRLAAEGMLLRLAAGELLTEKGLGQRELFVVMDGLFAASDGDRLLRMLGPGDLIGEVAHFSTAGRRTASVRAVGDGRVFVLRESALKRLRRSDPAAAAEVTTHFARVLADRMSAA